MTEVDHFVFLDDVQLSRQSWQTRNRILVNGQIHWVTAPIRHLGKDQALNDVELVDDEHWRRKITRMLRESYSRHPHGSDIASILAMLEKRQPRLVELNLDLIEYCADQFSISTPRRRSSSMHLSSADRTDRLIEICRVLECDTYLSSPGSADYLELDEFERRCNICLKFAEYTPPPYSQHRLENFTSHLSIVDVIANLGWQGASHYIRAPWTGRGENLELVIGRPGTGGL
jgi:hypothetical protein